MGGNGMPLLKSLTKKEYLLKKYKKITAQILLGEIRPIPKTKKERVNIPGSRA
jgi:hypothetical protein